MDYEEKKKNVMKWIDEAVDEIFDNYQNLTHVRKYHVNLNNEQLMRRVKQEHIDATTFVGSYDKIVSLLKEITIARKEELAEYIADDEWRDEFFIVDSFDRYNTPVRGKGYFLASAHDWEKGPLNCPDIALVFGKTKQEEVYLASAYPSIEEKL